MAAANIAITSAVITPNPVYTGNSYTLSVQIQPAGFVLGDDTYRKSLLQERQRDFHHGIAFANQLTTHLSTCLSTRFATCLTKRNAVFLRDFERAFLIPFEVDHVEHLIFFLYHTKRCVVRVPGTLAHHRRITRGAAPFGCAIRKKTAISKRW